MRVARGSFTCVFANDTSQAAALLWEKRDSQPQKSEDMLGADGCGGRAEPHKTLHRAQKGTAIAHRRQRHEERGARCPV